MKMASDKPRQKRFTRRSRTGCRTCRARHVKCDETPGACQNCTSAGWKCEGYDANRIKRPTQETNRRIDIMIPSLTLQQLHASALVGKNADESRAVSFFQLSTVPKMAWVFDSSLWSKLVLPMSHAEPAVIHAVIAVSTLHEDLEVRGTPLSREDLGNNRHRFALEQYGRALSALNRRQSIQDSELRGVLLTCCLLFVLFELLRGRYDPAFLHLQNGLSIVHGSRSKEGSCKNEDIDVSLAEAMARLDCQAAFFGTKAPYFKPISIDEAVFRENDLRQFHTLSEARSEIDSLSYGVFSFIRYRKLSSTEIELMHGCPLDLEKERVKLTIQLNQYLTRLNQSKRSLQLRGTREKRGFDLVLLQHMSLSVLLETYLDDDETLNSDAHLDACEEIIDLAEQITHSMMEECGLDPRCLPTLSLDTGIIPSLAYVCSKCPKATTRQRALKLLDTWPHREGLWDSNLIAILGRQLLAIETEAEIRRLSKVGKAPMPGSIVYISNMSRAQNVFMKVADDQTHAVIFYTTKDSDQEAASRERLVILDKH
ncbi:hypothetical protein BGW36DRAFT_212922 [Talaromyces proteolyticus]|uniref:Zn(2)-C6 fungal-type domain-containing protein n=1 Tax=Talaromyces proteolyticus TaxID=1131652 RepID=A0AAD4PY22_9EURO|nr:uncharacterized protein BGW36DRAFT_212922 [Talaromyces proteolyticus]KAH8693939.1 hypothetical protein BGW36DRAFT_212922 [Talaromyces proteolyticus]